MATSQPALDKAPPSAAVALPPAPWKWVAPVGVGLLIAALPVPAGLTPNAMRYFALFAAVVTALVTEPLPAPAIGLIGMAAAAATRLVADAVRDRARAHLLRLGVHLAQGLLVARPLLRCPVPDRAARRRGPLPRRGVSLSRGKALC